MKRKRIPALILALALCAGMLASAVAAVDTDAQSQATPKSAQEDGTQMKPENGGTSDGEARSPRRTRRAKKEEAAEPAGAVGKDAAKAAALADAGLTEDQAGKLRARVSDSDGTVVYKVRFTVDGQRYSYKIDAMTGEILDRQNRASDSGKRGGEKNAEKSDEAGPLTDAGTNKNDI